MTLASFMGRPRDGNGPMAALAGRTMSDTEGSDTPPGANVPRQAASSRNDREGSVKSGLQNGLHEPAIPDKENGLPYNPVARLSLLVGARGFEPPTS